MFDEASDIAYFSGVELTVEKGESYYFEMTPVNSTESRAQVYVWPEFEKAVETSENSLIGSQEDWDETAYQENSAAWWPANNWTQGNNNWYMYYGSVTDNLGELSHQEGVYWIANNPNNWTGVWHYHIAKTIYDSLVFAWKAPHTGTVAFNGRAFSCTNLGNEEKDFVLKIYKGSASGIVLFDKVKVSASDVVYLNNEIQQVKAGDVFYFEFDSEQNSETDIWVNIKPTYMITAAAATLEFFNAATKMNCYVDDVVTLPTAEKTGYAFGGWKNGNQVYKESYTVTGNVTFEPIWIPNQYTITFENCDLEAITDDYGATVSVIAPTKVGYTFAGWTKEGAAYTFDTMPAENITVKANWTVNQYTITFEGCELEAITDDYGATVNVTAPTKVGHTFAGWTKDDVVYTFGAMPAENITVKANWTVNQYTVTFEEFDLQEIKVFYGEQITVDEPKKNGYVFVGWSKDGVEYELGVMPAEDITLTANWKKKASGCGGSVSVISFCGVIMFVGLCCGLIRKKENNDDLSN